MAISYNNPKSNSSSPLNVLLVRYFFDLAGLRGTAKWVAIAIADFANAEGIAYPGQAKIARRCDCSTKTVQRAVKQLAEAGHLEIVGGLGKGNLQGYRFPIKDIQMSTLKPPISGQKKVKKRAKSGQKGTGLNRKVEVLKKRVEEKSDERSSHPAIQMVRAITNRYPPKPIWNRIIAAVGDEPIEEIYRASFENWTISGYRPNNFAAWLFDAAKTGRPWEKGKYGEDKRTASERNVDRIEGTIATGNRIDQGTVDRIRAVMSFARPEGPPARQLTTGDGAGSVDSGDGLGGDTMREHTD